MNLTSIKSTVALGLLVASLLPATAADPTGDELLRKMSSKLAASGSFTFEATREIDAALLEGFNIPQKAKVAVSVQRPDKISVKAAGSAGIRRFIADGKTLALVDEKENFYATVPMRGSLDALVEQLDAKYGFTPPLAEFAVSNPYQELHRQVRSVTYLGRSKSRAGLFGWFGEECDRIWLSGKEADAELWLAVSDGLPRTLIATFHREGKPQLHVSFSKWNLAAPVTAGEFHFTPAKGSQQIELWTTAKMQSAARER